MPPGAGVARRRALPILPGYMTMDACRRAEVKSLATHLARHAILAKGVTSLSKSHIKRDNMTADRSLASQGLGNERVRIRQQFHVIWHQVEAMLAKTYSRNRMNCGVEDGQSPRPCG
jgi:hypothetical protein